MHISEVAKAAPRCYGLVLQPAAMLARQQHNATRQPKSKSSSKGTGDDHNKYDSQVQKPSVKTLEGRVSTSAGLELLSKLPACHVRCHDSSDLVDLMV